MTFAGSGKTRRLRRLFRSADARSVILPIDDGLISGPRGQLSDLVAFFDAIRECPPDGILLFAGVLARYCASLADVTAIVNVTASTNRTAHTRKVLCADVETAVAAGADLVAAQVNVTSSYEGDMLQGLGAVVRRAERFGLPVLAIMYSRKENGTVDDNYDNLKTAHPDQYSDLVAHAARIGMELGADVIKTQYTGSSLRSGRREPVRDRLSGHRPHAAGLRLQAQQRPGGVPEPADGRQPQRADPGPHHTAPASDAAVQRSVTVSPRTHALYRCPPKSAWTVPGALV